jgi:23S rRNA (adenine1618-N6)-methyltransferase
MNSDVDEKSMQFAKQNVNSNGMQKRVKLLQTQKSDRLLPLDTMGFDKY